VRVSFRAAGNDAVRPPDAARCRDFFIVAIIFVWRVAEGLIKPIIEANSDRPVAIEGSKFGASDGMGAVEFVPDWLFGFPFEEVSEGDGFVEGNIHGCFDIVLESVRSVGEVLFEFLDVVVDILRTVLERLEKIEGECAVSRQNDGVGRQNDGGGAGSWAK